MRVHVTFAFKICIVDSFQIISILLATVVIVLLQNVEKMYEQDLEQAILQSRIDFENKVRLFIHEHLPKWIQRKLPNFKLTLVMFFLLSPTRYQREAQATPIRKLMVTSWKRRKTNLNPCPCNNLTSYRSSELSLVSQLFTNFAANFIKIMIDLLSCTCNTLV